MSLNIAETPEGYDYPFSQFEGWCLRPEFLSTDVSRSPTGKCVRWRKDSGPRGGDDRDGLDDPRELAFSAHLYARIAPRPLFAASPSRGLLPSTPRMAA